MIRARNHTRNEMDMARERSVEKRIVILLGEDALWIRPSHGGSKNATPQPSVPLTLT